MLTSPWRQQFKPGAPQANTQTLDGRSSVFCHDTDRTVKLGVEASAGLFEYDQTG